LVDADIGTFATAFSRVVGAFRVHLKADEMDTLMRTYFKILEAYSISDVLLAAKACITKSRTFPKPADWLAECAALVHTKAPKDLRWMSVTEMDALAHAAATAYQQDPCFCPACHFAGVDDRPQRFIPTPDGRGGHETAFNSRLNRVEPIGHWAHGDELARWYAARDHFFGLFKTAVKRRQISPVLHLVGAVEREPGEEG
jgi:hypothetical protein